MFCGNNVTEGQSFGHCNLTQNAGV